MKPDETKSRGHGDKKSRKLDEFIGALLANPSVEAAAEAVGIGRVTAWRWMRDPAVVERIRIARREALEHAMARIQQAAGQAVDTLCDLQTSGESESARLGAARCVLEMSLHTVALENIQKRLDALEALAKGNWKGSVHDVRGSQASDRPPRGVNGGA